MTLVEWLSDPASWPMVALGILFLMGSFYAGPNRSKYAGVSFAWIVLKVATHLDFSLVDRCAAMAFAFLGTIFLIDSVRAKG